MKTKEHADSLSKSIIVQTCFFQPKPIELVALVIHWLVCRKAKCSTRRLLSYCMKLPSFNIKPSQSNTLDPLLSCGEVFLCDFLTFDRKFLALELLLHSRFHGAGSLLFLQLSSKCYSLALKYKCFLFLIIQQPNTTCLNRVHGDW